MKKREGQTGEQCVCASVRKYAYTPRVLCASLVCRESCKSFILSLTCCCQINLLLEYAIWNSSNSFRISKCTTNREECCSLKLVPDLWKHHVSLLPEQIGKLPITCLNLLRFQLPGLLRQKPPLCLIYPCNCLILLLCLPLGIFLCSTIIRKENSLPFLVLPEKKNLKHTLQFTELTFYKPLYLESSLLSKGKMLASIHLTVCVTGWLLLPPFLKQTLVIQSFQ